MQLLVGLGNPGAEYAKTRHNAGFWLIDKLISQNHQRLQTAPKLEPKFKGLVTKLTLADNPCWILQPSTYMNRSGEAVLALSQFYKISPQQMVIIHDELDLPVGTVRVKYAGGHGGHNGLRDIIAQLGSNEFYRLRIGIGHPGNRDLVHDYVLHRPPLSEELVIQTSIDKALNAIPNIVAGLIDKATQYLHQP